MNIYEGIDNYRWLYLQAQRPVGEFVEVAKKIEMNGSEWTKFWRDFSDRVQILRKIDRLENGERYDVILPSGKERNYNAEEYGEVVRLYGEPEIISNCCGERCSHGKCMDCGENCVEVYKFEEWNENE